LCTAEANAPGSIAEALRMADAALGYLRDPGAASLLPAELGGVLEAMGALGGKFAAARAAVLARFEAERAYTADGHGSCTAWLKARGRMTGKAAGVRGEPGGPGGRRAGRLRKVALTAARPRRS
jgi:hypothetical protein